MITGKGPPVMGRYTLARSTVPSRMATAMSRSMSTSTVLPAEAEQTLRVPGEDRVALVVGDAHERRIHRLPRVRPVGRDVWVVARPEHPFDPDRVPVLDRVRIGDERRGETLLHVLARHAREMHVAE